MESLIVALVPVAIVAAVVSYLLAAKKRGKKCIGCPSGSACCGCCKGKK